MSLEQAQDYPSALPAKEESKITYVQRMISAGEQFRDKFKPTWDIIEDYIRQIPPLNWNDKEDWQTRTFTPMFSKASEVIPAYLKKMLFSNKRNFTAYATRNELEHTSFPLMQVFEGLLDKGRFEFANDFVIQEACDIGSSFLKLQITPDMKSIDFIWRSAYSCIVDPEARHDFYKSRFWAEEYTQDIATLIELAKDSRNGYDLNAVWDLIREGELSLGASAEQAYTSVRGIDGTTLLNIKAEFQKVTIHEFWGKVKVSKKMADGREYDTWEERMIILANKKHIIKDVENPYGFIPVVMCRTKKRKYDVYGRGFLENVRGLQELGNSIVNLGFDSAKISGMDITIIDDTKVADESSIQIKPNAIWKMKDINAVKFSRAGISALSEMFKGWQQIDAMFQEATGALRQIEGTNQGGSDTLGEYQNKLAMVDTRFLDQAKFIESDYFLKALEYMFKIIVNPKLFVQAGIDDILGKATVPNVEFLSDGSPLAVTPKPIPKLDLQRIRDYQTHYEFKVVGVTNFAEKVSILKKIDGLMMRATTNPAFAQFLNMDNLITKYLELSDIPDYQDMLIKKAPASPEPMPMGAGQTNPSVTPNAGQLAPKETTMPPIVQ